MLRFGVRRACARGFQAGTPGNLIGAPGFWTCAQALFVGGRDFLVRGQAPTPCAQGSGACDPSVRGRVRRPCEREGRLTSRDRRCAGGASAAREAWTPRQRARLRCGRQHPYAFSPRGVGTYRRQGDPARHRRRDSSAQGQTRALPAAQWGFRGMTAWWHARDPPMPLDDSLRSPCGPAIARRFALQ